MFRGQHNQFAQNILPLQRYFRGAKGDNLLMHYDPIEFEAYPRAWEERWNFLRYFIDCWFAPIVPSDGYSPSAMLHLEKQLDCELPESIRTVLLHCGCRRDIWQFITESKTIFQKMERVGNFIVVHDMVPRFAFSVDQSVGDPELLHWDSTIKEASDFAGNFSDQLLATVIGSLWTGKGTRRIPYFTKCVRIEPESVRLGPEGEWLQEQEVAQCMTCSQFSDVQPLSYHSTNLVVQTAYPNSFRIAAREPAALQILPLWLRAKIDSDEDILSSYEFYRQQVGNTPFEPSHF